VAWENLSFQQVGETHNIFFKAPQRNPTPGLSSELGNMGVCSIPIRGKLKITEFVNISKPSAFENRSFLFCQSAELSLLSKSENNKMLLGKHSSRDAELGSGVAFGIRA
jgi:hypothetical protein